MLTPPPLKPKPKRPLPFADLPNLPQAEAIYIYGLSCMIFGVLFMVLIGIPLVVFVLHPIYVRWGYPVTLTNLTILLSFCVGYVLGGWAGTLLVLELGGSHLLKRKRGAPRKSV